MIRFIGDSEAEASFASLHVEMYAPDMLISMRKRAAHIGRNGRGKARYPGMSDNCIGRRIRL